MKIYLLSSTVSLYKSRATTKAKMVKSYRRVLDDAAVLTLLIVSQCERRGLAIISN